MRLSRVRRRRDMSAVDSRLRIVFDYDLRHLSVSNLHWQRSIGAMEDIIADQISYYRARAPSTTIGGSV